MYVTHTPHIHSRYERYVVHTSRLRGTLTATYVWRIKSMSYVSTAYLPRCFRMYDVCVMYLRRIGPVTYVLRIFKSAHIKKRSASAYDKYELRIEEYDYVCSRMDDVRVTYLPYLDTP